jgi:hypothetical protein
MLFHKHKENLGFFRREKREIEKEILREKEKSRRERINESYQRKLRMYERDLAKQNTFQTTVQKIQGKNKTLPLVNTQLKRTINNPGHTKSVVFFFFLLILF